MLWSQDNSSMTLMLTMAYSSKLLIAIIRFHVAWRHSNETLYESPMTGVAMTRCVDADNYS